jgi:hypothetical protein
MNRYWSVVTLAATTACSAPPVRFSEPEEISRVTDVGTTPMFAVSPAGVRAVAWVSAPDSGTDARLYIAIGDAAPVELRDALGPVEVHGESPPKLAYGPDGALNALYVVPKLVPGRRFPLAALRFTRSADGGKTWTTPVGVTDDALFGAHNFHALHAAADGALYVSWLDSRSGKPAVYLTRSTDGGRTWQENRPLGTGEACPCCRTGLASTADGTLYVAWRVVLPGNIRDIVVARSSDHGATWSAPVRVHEDGWEYAGCPHAGPSLQVDDENRLHVAWWTGKEGRAGVYYARSEDGGRSFGPAIALGAARVSRPAHVQVAVGSAVVVAWDDGTQALPRVLVRVSRDGGRSFSRAVPVSAPRQWAGFPVVALRDSLLTVAWSERTPESAAREERAMPDMRDKKAVMHLHSVGDAQVVARTGRIL